jgi:hypothetical protein
MRNFIKTSGGFILIELIVSIVLIGIIGVFTSLFIYTGIKGYLTVKDTNQAALKAQIALDRIGMELRKIKATDSVNKPDPDKSITYTSDDFTGTRKIEYDANSKTIKITGEGGVPYVLLDHVQTFTLTLDDNDNLDHSGDGSLEISGINIGFTIAEVGSEFNLRIYPRNMLPKP